jgi:hypothetical protein
MLLIFQPTGQKVKEKYSLQNLILSVFDPKKPENNFFAFKFAFLYSEYRKSHPKFMRSLDVGYVFR